MPPNPYPVAQCRYCHQQVVAAQLAQHEEDCADNPKNKD